MNELTPISHPDARYAVSVLTAFGRGHDIGISYNSMILSSDEPDVIDTYDTNISSLMRYATLYWPSGNPDHGRKVETIVHGDLRPEESAAEATRVRKLILGASIGASALARAPSYFRGIWDTVDAHAPGVALEAFKELCIDLECPLAVCAISTVTSDNLGRSILHFWHPGMVPPEPCLGELRQAIIES